MEKKLYYCGEMIVPEGLLSLVPFLSGCARPIELKKSGYDKTFYLRASYDEITLDMDSGQGPNFLFSGQVNSPVKRARYLLQEFSTALTKGNIVHRIELYEAVSSKKLVGYFHYGWPR